MGSFGSRSTAVGGSAVRQAALRVRERATVLAARLLESSPDDVEFGRRRGRGVRARRPGAAGRLAADRPSRLPGASAGRSSRSRAWRRTPSSAPTARPSRPAPTWPSCSIDRETGQVRLEQLVAVDDSGTVINPLLAEGQIHGAMAQGIGEALQERVVYDDGRPARSRRRCSTTPCRRPARSSRRSRITSSRRARSTRSAPRAWARPASSGRRRPSSTPRSTRWRRSASATSTRRSTPRRSGAS